MNPWAVILCLCTTSFLLSAEVSTPAPVAFFVAVERGDVAEVTRHLDRGVSPDARNPSDTNALYHACDHTQFATAKLLIERGADVNLLPKRKGGDTALGVTIRRGFDATELTALPGYRELIDLFLAKGVDVNAQDVDGNTSLIMAAMEDDIVTVKLLLKHGANIGHTNEDGWTALERAVSHRRRTTARELVALGAPLDAEQQKLKQRYEFARKAGLWFPFIVIGCFLLAALMHRRFKALPKREAAPGAGDDLPKLLPLKCNACGGSASLRPGVANCSRCHVPVPVPVDYTETLKLRERTFKLLEKAVTLWKRVRLVSVAPVRWALWIAAIAFVVYMWNGIFPHFVRDAFYDLMSFSGTMVWALSFLAMAAIAIALAGYAIYLAEVRKAVPALPETAAAAGNAEDIACPNCGGMVALEPGDIVGICGYCGSETYRVALAREARAAATEDRHSATVSLYQAMSRVYELRENAALAIPAAILLIGFILVTVAYFILLMI